MTAGSLPSRARAGRERLGEHDAKRGQIVDDQNTYAMDVTFLGRCGGATITAVACEAESAAPREAAPLTLDLGQLIHA